MDRRSWLWRRKSSEKSPGETESSGSVSSFSERYSDDQEVLRASSNNASPNHAQSPEVSSNASVEVNETVKSMTEKLSTALLNIRAKEDLVKQHAKVAEEAVSGWEKAETEVTALKQQLEAATQKDSALEEKISHLDGALKECVRQLRQSREEQEQKIHDALEKKTREWESEKFELDTRLVELQAQLEVSKATVLAPVDHDLQSKLESLMKENSALKVELLTQSEELQILTLERELSIRAAETASKQHLESIKKVTKLEAECRRLRVAARKTSRIYEHKLVPSSAYVESLTDSQSDSGERLLGVDNEQSCSDSWASALIAELDQFKSEKAGARNITTFSVEIDLMDDFLEMERLAALPEGDCGGSSFELEASSDQTPTGDGTLKAELEIVQRQVAELEQKVEKMANEKADIEMALAETRNELNNSSNQLIIAENKLIELQRQLELANGVKNAIEIEVEPVEASKMALRPELKPSNVEIGKLHEKVSLLELKVEDERVLSTKFAAKCWDLEAAEGKQKVLESELEGALMEVGKLSEKVGLLQSKVDDGAVQSIEFAAKCQDLEAMECKKALESQLKLAQVEARELREKVGLLEGEVEEKRALSAELSSNMEASEAQKKAMESRLESMDMEVHKLCAKVGLLERKVEEERTLSAELAIKVEVSEEKNNVLDSQLKSAHLEVEKLLEKTCLLERKIEEEMALYAELGGNLEASVAMKKACESQLQAANLEVRKLHEKVTALEMKVQEERALSANLAADAEALDTKKMAMESQLESANLEIGNLHDKVALLEMQVQEERAISVELATNLEDSDAKKMLLESQLESANFEVGKLLENVGLLERKVEEEMALSAEFAVKCQNLENEASRKKLEVDFKQAAGSKGELKLRQEKEFATAAGKLVECQKTIASLSRQLKSLTDMEDLLESEMPELNRDFLNLWTSEESTMHSNMENMGTMYALPNGK